LIQPPDSEKAVGMEVYATDSPPCHARLRVRPDDFVVEEAFGLKAVSSQLAAGSVPLYRVEKRSMDTLHVARLMAMSLKSRVAYAGMKDKRAAAVQYMTPTSSRSERPKVVEDPNFTATLVGYLPRPISRSMIAGNRFRITLRECCPEIGERISQVLDAAASLRLPNFYGPQRFGTRDSLTHLVGRAMIQGKFEEAVRILLCKPRSADDEQTIEARRLMAEGKYEEGGMLLPERQDIEKAVARRLAREPGNSIRAMRAAPIAVRRLYAQAFQSYLFNRTLSRATAKGIDISSPQPGDNWGELAHDGLNLAKVHGVREPIIEGAVPLVQLLGFAYRNYGSRFDECIQKVMEEEQVEPREFFVKAMQEVSIEGGFRRPHLAVSEPTSEVSGEVAVLGFALPRGGYATVLLREIIKPSDPFASGFA
jgi:tRNA pseudouridine13 synthase